LSQGDGPAPVSTGAGHLALEGIGVEKVYGGELALAGVHLEVRAGEIHGLLGANGAGKSTLVRIVSRAEAPSRGIVKVFGENIHAGFTSNARHGDVAYIHQDRALAPDLSIADNIALSVGFKKRFGFVDRRATQKQAREAMKLVDIDLDPMKLVRELTVGEQTLIAIARALASSAKLILLDEPTANLGTQDKKSLLNRLKGLSSQGVASLLITHSLDEALEVCHRVTVLRNGYVVATKETANLSTDEIAELMMGRSVKVQSSKSSTAADEVGGPVHEHPRLRLREFSSPGLGPVSLDVFPGEIVGVTGLADSGHLLFGEVLLGVMKLTGGSVEINGQPYQPKTVDRARRSGIGFVPADRLRDGLAPTLNLRENLFLDGANPSGKRSRKSELAMAKSLLVAANVKPPNPEAPISTLSGGNMQKVLVAKWLAMKPQLLILSEPTVGVDVGAREEIYLLLRQACREGISILLTSSDAEELVRLCDRVLVLRAGAVVAHILKGDISAESLTALTSSNVASAIHRAREGAH
jgi:ribose transport system ATP-binding protein